MPRRLGLSVVFLLLAPFRKAEQLSQMEQVWYGCCSQVQYTEGIICFVSGLWDGGKIWKIYGN